MAEMINPFKPRPTAPASADCWLWRLTAYRMVGPRHARPRAGGRHERRRLGGRRPARSSSLWSPLRGPRRPRRVSVRPGRRSPQTAGASPERTCTASLTLFVQFDGLKSRRALVPGERQRTAPLPTGCRSRLTLSIGQAIAAVATAVRASVEALVFAERGSRGRVEDHVARVAAGSPQVGLVGHYDCGMRILLERDGVCPLSVLAGAAL